jgi:peroxiredoxin
VISCRMELWPGSTGFSLRRTVFHKRANVIIDEKQKIVFVKVYPVHSVPDIGEVITFIKNKKSR